MSVPKLPNACFSKRSAYLSGITWLIAFLHARARDHVNRRAARSAGIGVALVAPFLRHLERTSHPCTRDGNSKCAFARTFALCHTFLFTMSASSVPRRRSAVVFVAIL